jgi:competence ComEA-like helix-hairpin-helix protein
VLRGENINRRPLKNIACRLICCLLFFALLLPARPGSASGLPGRLNINTATVQQLQELPYIGESRARAIVTYRQGHGPFQNLDELTNVADIGEKSLEAIRPYLTLGPEPPSQHQPSSVTFTGQITTRPGDIQLLPDGRYYPTLVDFIKKAEHSIDMAMFLFKTTTSPGNKPAMLVKELIAARKRGVHVRVVLEHSGRDESLNKENRRVAEKLRKGNIRVFFDTPATTTHTKVVVIDRRHTFIGSHNLSQSAMAYNHEVSLLVDNSALAAELIAYMDTLH